ncbi:Uncharacterised protein [Mycobacterium tuberculosis]|nr:Uncharacterised protein [Mycobacterium tuberculosis]
MIRISPEDLSLPYITDLQVIRFMDSLNVKLDLFWIALWKHVLLVFQVPCWVLGHPFNVWKIVGR